MSIISRVTVFFKKDNFNMFNIFFSNLLPVMNNLAKELDVQISAIQIIKTYHELNGAEDDLLAALINTKQDLLVSASNILDAHKQFGMDSTFDSFSKSQAHDLISIADLISEGAFKKMHDKSHDIIFKTRELLDRSDTEITKTIYKYI